MTEFVVIALAVAILIVLSNRQASRAGVIVAGGLLALWLPVLVLGIYDFPQPVERKELLTLSPLTLLIFAPLICIVARCGRKRG